MWTPCERPAPVDKNARAAPGAVEKSGIGASGTAPKKPFEPTLGRLRASFHPNFPPIPMSWHGHLQLNYRLDPNAPAAQPRTLAHDRHHGPLRVLQRLYPEGDAICHHVLVHPPGGLVGGDRLDVDLALEPGSHALVTTPGATRFYRSAGDTACQQVTARLGDGARLEWLPLETIAYDACLAENRLRFELAPGAQTMGWDLLALGLPAADLAWRRGRFHQRVELPGVWLERASIHADDTRLLDSPLGWAGHRVLGTFWLAAGAPLPPARLTLCLDRAREAIAASGVAATAGVTSPHAQVVVLRLLADRVEPAMALMQQVWAAWRQAAWDLPPCQPRIWRM
jgi:urease accessory protein